MARVLIVEDEERYREIVARYLTLRGHEVFETATGHDAIAVGLQRRPQVLVADWMLRHSVHGLHVAEALHAADPGLHTVLVTGFPASDLTIDRQRVGIVDLLEKPFDVEDLGKAVENAANALPGSEGEVIAILIVDAGGAIVHRNQSARALLKALPAGEGAAALSDVFPLEQAVALGEASEDWRQATPVGEPTHSWWVRTRALEGGGQLVALCTLSQEWRRYDPRVRMLLGLPLGVAASSAFREPLMLVDDSETIRETFVAQVVARGGVGHAAGRHRQAIELFRGDDAIRSVILDWAMPGENLRATVAQLREIRPEVRLIGTSGEDRSAEFSRLGIDSFLLKPWTVAGELASLLESESQRSPESHP